MAAVAGIGSATFRLLFNNLPNYIMPFTPEEVFLMVQLFACDVSNLRLKIPLFSFFRSFAILLDCGCFRLGPRGRSPLLDTGSRSQNHTI